MQNTHQHQETEDFSLVDIAAVFVRRRYVFYVSFVLITLLGVVYAMMQPDKYEYVTLIEGAEKDGAEYVQNPAATVSTIANRWVPEVVSGYRARTDQTLPFRIQAGNPEDTGLIRLISVAAEEHADLVKSTHQTLADNIIERQRQLFEMQQKNLKAQIALMSQVMDSLQSQASSNNGGSALTTAIQKRAELEGELESLKQAELLVVGRQSIDRKGPKTSLLVVLAVILGVLMGLFLAFSAEFIARVQAKLNQGAGQ